MAYLTSGIWGLILPMGSLEPAWTPGKQRFSEKVLGWNMELRGYGKVYCCCVCFMESLKAGGRVLPGIPVIVMASVKVARVMNQSTESRGWV